MASETIGGKCTSTEVDKQQQQITEYRANLQILAAKNSRFFQSQ